MKDPCEICMDKDRCGGSQPCKKKIAYTKYKEKCKVIAAHTKEAMQRAKEKRNNEVDWKKKIEDDFMKKARR